MVHATTQRDARDAIAAGADGLAHIFADSMIAPDFAKFARDKKVFVIPTLSVLEAITETPGETLVGPNETEPVYLTRDEKYARAKVSAGLW